MTKPIYRQAALDQLSSPEQLNQLIRTTPRRSWIALLGLVAILATAVVWSIFGNIPIRMSGRGVLIHEGGIFNVVAQANGQLTDFKNIRPGQKIVKGQVIGHLVRPELEQQVTSAENYIQRLQETHAPIQELASAQDALSRLRFEAALDTDLVSERTGVVTEVLVYDGDTLKEGEPILSVEYADTPLRAIIYLPSQSDAARLKPGVAAEISPVTSRREINGYLIGRVLSVSKYPASEATIMSVLNNATLAHDLAANGSPVAVEVSLLPDRSTASGYKWSSRAGAGQEVDSGMLCTASFVIEQRRPISFLFPGLDHQNAGG